MPGRKFNSADDLLCGDRLRKCKKERLTMTLGVRCVPGRDGEDSSSLIILNTILSDSAENHFTHFEAYIFIFGRASTWNSKS